MAVKLIYTKGATPYMDAYKQTEAKLRANNAEVVSGFEKDRDSEIQKSNAGYDATAQQNWVNYMRSQKNLPSQLNAMGIRGGASESSLIRMGNTYGTNVATNNQARMDAANSIRDSYAKQIADSKATLASQLASEYETARNNQIAYEQREKEKDLEQFSSVIDGLYKSKKSYKKLIASLKASNDPNKKMKILLATRAMNALGGSGGGGGGGGRRYGGGGSYGGSYTNNDSGARETARGLASTVGGVAAGAVGAASSRGGRGGTRARRNYRKAAKRASSRGWFIRG